MRGRDSPTASVVVPTFRSRSVLELCLEALRLQSFKAFETIVVDDGGGEGTAEWAEQRFPEVEVLTLPVNRGFCGAVNAGIRVARGRIVALLNDDALPDRAWLEELVAILDSDPGVGFCASRMLRHDAPNVLDGAGDAYSRHGLSFRVGRGEHDDGRYGARSVLWVSGGACAYRRELLSGVGLLDEGFFAYYEDVDLGLRARRAGWEGRYVPSSVVQHIGGQSDSGGRSVVLTTRNSLLTVAKHWPWPLIARNVPFLFYGQARNGLWAVRHGQAGAWVRGLVSALRAWPTARRAERPQTAVWAGDLTRSYPFRSFIRRR